MAVACGASKASEPATPVEPPPLPPASGTIIGILLDDAAQLGLRDSQLGALREIDHGLAARNAELDRRQGAGDGSKQSRSASERGRGGGRIGGGGMDGPRRGMGGGRGGMGGARGGRGAGASAGSGSGSPDHRPPPDRGARIRAMHDRDALGRALALLDEPQQAIARRILEQHDVDVDLVLAGPQGARAEPAAAPSSE